MSGTPESGVRSRTPSATVICSTSRLSSVQVSSGKGGARFVHSSTGAPVTQFTRKVMPPADISTVPGVANTAPAGAQPSPAGASVAFGYGCVGT